MTTPSPRKRLLDWTRPADFAWGTGATLLTSLLLWLLFGAQATISGAPVVTAPTPDAIVAAGEPLLVAGSAAPNQRLSIAGDDQTFGEVTSGADGLFSYELTSLDPGAYDIVVRAVDAAGREIAASAPVPVTITGTRMAEPVTALAGDRMPQIDLLGENLAFDASESPVISGTGMPGATVALLDGETTVAETIVDDNSRWTLDLSSLGAGEFALALRQRFPDGLETILSEPLKVSIAGLRAPRITIPAGGLAFAAGQPVVLEGTGAPGATVAVSDAAGNVLGEAVVDSAGQWTLTLPALKEGEYPLSLSQTTAEGQVSEVSSPVSVSVAPAAAAAVAPEVTATSTLAGAAAGVAATPAVTSPAIGEALPAGEPVTLEGTGAPGATITVTDSAGEELGQAPVDAAGQWTLTLPELTPGDYALTLTQTTSAGEATTASEPVALTVDETGMTLASAPGAVAAPAVTSPAIGEALPAGEPVTLEGSGAPGATITVTDSAGEELGQAAVDAAGQWTLTLPELTPGDYALTLTQTTSAGEATTLEEAVALSVEDVEYMAPEVTKPGTDFNVVSGATVTLEGIGQPGAAIAVTEGAQMLAESAVQPNGAWSAVLPGLTPGIHTLTLEQTTVGGAVTESATPISVTVVEEQKPAVIVQPGGAGSPTPVTLQSGQTISGTASPGAKVEVYAGDTFLGTAQADEEGHWQFRLPASLPPTTAELTIKTLDASGAPLDEGVTPVTAGPPLLLPVTGGSLRWHD